MLYNRVHCILCLIVNALYCIVFFLLCFLTVFYVLCYMNCLTCIEFYILYSTPNIYMKFH